MSQAARRFAEWSAIGSLVLGMAGQVAYHLLTQAGTAHPPWAITTAVSCLPVLVLGMGAALAHLLSADACDSRVLRRPRFGHLASRMTSRWTADHKGWSWPESGSQTQRGSAVGHGPDQVTTMKRSGHQGGTDCHSPKTSTEAEDRLWRRERPGNQARLADARTAARTLTKAGQRVSRRNLRRAGLRGSNAELGALGIYAYPNADLCRQRGLGFHALETKLEGLAVARRIRGGESVDSVFGSQPRSASPLWAKQRPDPS